MKVLYFARFRQIIGRGGDDVARPAHVETAGDLLEHLGQIDAGCAAAFANRKLVRVAVNQTHVQFDHPLQDADEVAFFPPVTGG
jgi:sulfur-carrier protein